MVIPKLQYVPTITLGAILQILTLLGASLAAYVVLVGNDIKHDERIASNALEVARLERKMDIQVANRNTQMEELTRSIRNIDEKLTRFIISELEDKLQVKNATTRTK